MSKRSLSILQLLRHLALSASPPVNVGCIAFEVVPKPCDGIPSHGGRISGTIIVEHGKLIGIHHIGGRTGLDASPQFRDGSF
jgi:hypothetical protein